MRPFTSPSACSSQNRMSTSRSGAGGRALAELLHLRLRLLQPEAHLHLPVHRRRGGEVLASLLARAGAPVELAEAVVAAGNERTHLQLLGEREGGAVVTVGMLRGIAAGGDLSEEAKGPRLVAALAALAGKGQGSPGEFESVLEPIGEDVRFAQVPKKERQGSSKSHRLTGAHRVLQQRDAFSDPPRERVGVAQASHVVQGKEGQVPLATQGQRTFQEADGVAELSPGVMEIGENPATKSQAVRMIERFGEADAFLAVSASFLDLSPVGETPGQVTAGHHGRKSREGKPFPAPIAFKQLQDLPEEILGPSIGPRPEAGQAEVEVRGHLKLNIPQGLGKSLGTLAKPEAFHGMTSHVEVVAHMDGDLAESPLIVECPGLVFGFAETAEDPLEFSERKECCSQLEAKIDGLL